MSHFVVHWHRFSINTFQKFLAASLKEIIRSFFQPVTDKLKQPSKYSNSNARKQVFIVPFLQCSLQRDWLFPITCTITHGKRFTSVLVLSSRGMRTLTSSPISKMFNFLLRFFRKSSLHSLYVVQVYPKVCAGGGGGGGMYCLMNYHIALDFRGIYISRIL